MKQAVALGFRKHSVFRKLWWKFPLIQSQYQTGARTLRAHTVGTAHRHLVQRVGNRTDVAALRCIDKQFPQLCQRQRYLLQHMAKDVQQLHQHLPSALIEPQGAQLLGVHLLRRQLQQVCALLQALFCPCGKQKFIQRACKLFTVAAFSQLVCQLLQRLGQPAGSVADFLQLAFVLVGELFDQPSRVVFKAALQPQAVVHSPQKAVIFQLCHARFPKTHQWIFSQRQHRLCVVTAAQRLQRRKQQRKDRD